MAKKNIPTFMYFVIPMLLSASVATALGGIKPFVAFGSDVLSATSSDGPTLPQLKIDGELGLVFPLVSRLDFSFSLGGMLVYPSVPTESILYRGYYGTFVATALDFLLSEDHETTPFLSIGGSCALARYTRTDLNFLAYSLHVAPGISHISERIDLRLSLPVGAEFRGDGTSFSVGLTLAFAAVGSREAEERR